MIVSMRILNGIPRDNVFADEGYVTFYNEGAGATSRSESELEIGVS